MLPTIEIVPIERRRSHNEAMSFAMAEAHLRTAEMQG
jgi:Tfp pilus assembly protein PilX